MRRPYTRPIQQEALRAAITKSRRPLGVFVAGPYIERNWDEVTLSKKDPAAVLRIAIIDHVENARQHSAILGEHRGVLELGDEFYRSRSSALITEMTLVKSADAIIILPSSPGSFCEIGSWVPHELLCKKMLIIADAQYKEPKGYLHLGVYKTATDHGAKFQWLDYKSKEAVISSVEIFLNDIEDAEMSKEALSFG